MELQLLLLQLGKTGLGTWLNRWFPLLTVEHLKATNDNVTLEVPAGVATAGTHTQTSHGH